MRVLGLIASSIIGASVCFGTKSMYFSNAVSVVPTMSRAKGTPVLSLSVWHVFMICSAIFASKIPLFASVTIF